jgi:hypothetical protein
MRIACCQECNFAAACMQWTLHSNSGLICLLNLVARLHVTLHRTTFMFVLIVLFLLQSRSDVTRRGGKNFGLKCTGMRRWVVKLVFPAVSKAPHSLDPWIVEDESVMFPWKSQTTNQPTRRHILQNAINQLFMETANLTMGKLITIIFALALPDKVQDHRIGRHLY